MTGPIRWGILGCGSIARAMASAIKETDGALLMAVASRDPEKAQKFASEFGARQAYGCYEELAKSDGLDVIYVATPHPMHRDHTWLCLENGKAVLCEKPFAMSALEAREMAALAQERGLFLMEAMWTRCFPITRQVREWVRQGAVGSVRIVAADFGFQAKFDARSRLFDPHLGGGALLDVGVYAMSYASMILGQPNQVVSAMRPAPTGVDAQSAIVLGYADGAMAVLYTSLETTTPWEATILGDRGRIRVHSPFWKPTAATLTTDGGDEIVEMPYQGNGFQFEVEEVNRCLRSGESESRLMPLEETIAVLETMDAVRRQWGLQYPGE